jgi:hypothetical protein
VVNAAEAELTWLAKAVVFRFSLVEAGRTMTGNLLRMLAVAVLGVFAGAMLTEGAVLVPYWQSLTAQEFFAWYAANDRLLLDYFGAVTIATALATLLAAGLSLWERHPSRGFAVAAMLVTVGLVLMFPLYFRDVNTAFAAATIPESELSAELLRWSSWHWTRTGFSFLALALAMAACMAGTPPRSGQVSAQGPSPGTTRRS